MRVFWSGNIAVAEGALRAGCKFFAAYPITPASDLMEYMLKRIVDVGGVFVQAEDEIAAINMVIGASWAGVKAMTAT
ncbi:MAG TPA: 2-oxoacid:acceptor oxidoreductase subunit alpha, partial [Desulfurococcales archaeon]|nr:2-oxoacid:acceptor oxidoreductase subunit alpha [Desulfurococcales archaeon]